MENTSPSASFPPANDGSNQLTGLNLNLEARPGLNVNKELPYSPAEQAGLRDQQRQYTKELRGPSKPPEIDPNHPYPNKETATTLHLCTTSPSIWLIASSSRPFSLARHKMWPFTSIRLDRLQSRKWSSGTVHHPSRDGWWRIGLWSEWTHFRRCWDQYGRRRESH